MSSLESMTNDLRKAINAAGSIRKYSSLHGISVTMISNVLNGNTPFTPRIGKLIGWHRDRPNWVKINEGDN